MAEAKGTKWLELGVLECEGVWDVVGVRRFGELTEQGCSSSALDAGVVGKAEEGGVWVLKDSGRGRAMAINGIDEFGSGWRVWVWVCVVGLLCVFILIFHFIVQCFSFILFI